jgi:type II secretory pathway pseudopilin PulG
MKIIKLKIKNYKGGYTIVELLFYIALFALLTLAVINGMITMTRAFRETTIQSEFLQSGNIVERISREVRQAYGIGSISATDLVLNTKDAGGANKTVEFLLSGSNLQMLENSVLTGNLNTPNISVTALTFTQITTSKGQAVKIFLTVKSNNDALNRAENFYDTVVLRGSYQ